MSSGTECEKTVFKDDILVLRASWIDVRCASRCPWLIWIGHQNETLSKIWNVYGSGARSPRRANVIGEAMVEGRIHRVRRGNQIVYGLPTDEQML
ncbi:hypothetical protein GOBAR_AA38729 [Gossypium barbadense]|uniref:Uncharacterized protein n=1 Tax=Gossypium barbadense TaxID=3634 RepID=A0A2P5VT14_GOSBA|nr:hypothetical protein GOBAR_AA38729 [Gossypium barbadense]